MKIITFDPSIDGVTVKNIGELREHFTIEIPKHARRGLLDQWLSSRKLSGDCPTLETERLLRVIGNTRPLREVMKKTVREYVDRFAEMKIKSASRGSARPVRTGHSPRPERRSLAAILTPATTTLPDLPESP